MKWRIEVVNGAAVLFGASFDEAGAEIHETSDGTFALFELLQYGDGKIFIDFFPTLGAAIAVVNSWG